MKLVEDRGAKAAENSTSPVTGSQDDGHFMPSRTGFVGDRYSAPPPFADRPSRA